MGDLALVEQHAANGILIADCGTSWEAIEIALANPSASVTASDLSLSCLAFARRRPIKYGAQNLEMVHGDILDLQSLPDFDLIISSGVLHHMRNSLHGLRALRRVLRDDGTIRLAFYSASGRAPVVACIALREQLDLPSTPEGIERLREAIYQLPPEHSTRALLGWRDFYMLSECRDLAFHAQEHRYTLVQIGELLQAGGFKFTEMLAAPEAANQYQRALPNADCADMAAWATFESDHPGRLRVDVPV